MGLIVGVAAGGGFLVLAAIAILAIVLIKRRKSKQPIIASDIPMAEQNYSAIRPNNGTNYGSLLSPDSPKPRVSQTLTPLPANKYEIDYAELVFETPLGEG